MYWIFCLHERYVYLIPASEYISEMLSVLLLLSGLLIVYCNVTPNPLVSYVKMMYGTGTMRHYLLLKLDIPDSKVHGANIGPI